jgi:hypothetical protein
MIYLSTTQSREVNVTVGDIATQYTATYSINNNTFIASGQLPLLNWTGAVGAEYTFYSTNISLSAISDVRENAYFKLTYATANPIDGVTLLAKAPVASGNTYLWIALSGLNGLWPQNLICTSDTPNPPTIITYALTQSYLFSIQDQDTFLTYTFSNNDTSSNPYYFNSFSFSVITGATYGLTAGIIPAPQGNYIYNVYQTQYNGSLTPISDSLEVGLLVINGTYSNPNISVIGDDNTIKVDKNIN